MKKRKAEIAKAETTAGGLSRFPLSALQLSDFF